MASEKTSPQTPPVSPTSIRKTEVVKAGSIGFIGTFIDGYDLVIAATLSTLVFSKLFFPPKVSPALATVYSLLVVILLSYLFRPVGAFIFGHIGDRLGRKVGLVWDLVMVGIGALIVGLAPGYASAGYLGLAMLILGRILIGIGLGGEQGGGVTLAIEQANAAGSRWRGFWGSVPGLAWAFVGMATSGVLALLSALYPGQSFVTFGWRIALYVGAFAAVIGIIVRLALLESSMFEEVRRTVGVARLPAVEVFRYWKPILAGALLYASGNVAYYLYASLAPSFAVSVGFPRTTALQAVVIASIIVACLLVLFAVLGDMFGRRGVVLVSSLLLIPASVAYPLLIMAKSFPLLVLASALIWGVSTGEQILGGNAFLAEQFPTRYRYSGTGLGIQIGSVIGSGIGITLIGALIGGKFVQNWWVIPVIVSVYAVLSAIAPFVLMRETIKEKLTN